MNYARWVWATALLAACGSQIDADTTGAGIVRGTPTTAFPATVYVSLGGGECSGTLISPRVVLTAKHCMQGVPARVVDVFFGSRSGGQGTWIGAQHAETFPGFGQTGDGDLALITLDDVGPTPPIPPCDKDLAPHIGEPVTIVGFGVTSENGSDSGTKRVGETPLESVTNGTMISGHSGSGTCYGDSGGPNFMTIDSVTYVVGVTSYGTSACGIPSDIAARVDTHIDWINDYILEHDPADCGMDGRCAQRCPAVDPDCPCATDGFCTAACPDIDTDVDCAGCEMNGVCRADCPTLDVDCCAQDGMCNASCGEALDPDCDPCLENGQCVLGCAVVDPDCCGDDRMCVVECGNADPDCVACGANGECRADCPTVDPDCCVADARCEVACGDTDPDCVMTSPPDPEQPDPPMADPNQPVDQPGRALGKGRIGGGCTGAGMPELPALWLGLLALSLLRRRGAAGTRRA